MEGVYIVKLYDCDIASFFVTMRQLGIKEATQIEEYMEIGVADGDSTLAVIKQFKPGRVVLCDNWGDGHGGTGRGDHNYVEKRILETGYLRQDITFLDGDSRELIPRFFTLNPAAYFDLIHVDDDHSAKTLTGHLKVLLGHANFIACHDICMEGLKDAVYLAYLEHGNDHVLVFDGLTQSRYAIFVRRVKL